MNFLGLLAQNYTQEINNCLQSQILLPRAKKVFARENIYRYVYFSIQLGTWILDSNRQYWYSRLLELYSLFRNLGFRLPQSKFLSQLQVSVLGRCLPYIRELKKMAEERREPTLGVRFRAQVSALQRVKENDCMKNGRDQLWVCVLGRCLPNLQRVKGNN